MKTKHTLLVAACFALVALVCLSLAGQSLLPTLAAAGLAVGMAFAMKDDLLKVTRALPNGAATVSSTGFDLGHGAKGDFLANCELQIEAPALVVGDLANGDTMVYDVYHSTASDFSGEALLMSAVITQTGAGGAGAAAATKQVRFPIDVHRYVRVKITNDGAGDASDKTATLRLVF